MRGNGYVGAAGFGIATQNDSPMAAKAHILSAAFMGIEMKCARLNCVANIAICSGYELYVMPHRCP